MFQGETLEPIKASVDNSVNCSKCDRHRRDPSMSCDSSASPDSSPATRFTRFPIKLLTLLARAKASPRQIPSLGVSWCSDDRHLLAHTRFDSMILEVAARSSRHFSGLWVSGCFGPLDHNTLFSPIRSTGTNDATRSVLFVKPRR
jgi:hypothetical protein